MRAPLALLAATGLVLLVGTAPAPGADTGVPPGGGAPGAWWSVWERLDQTAQDARQQIERAWDAALAGARANLDQTLGLFVYDPDRALTERWTRVEGFAQPDRPTVLLIHGLDEGGTIWDDAAPALAAAGNRVVRFDYRNDQAIARSADDFADALRTLRRAGVHRLSIVAHSMGGLVTRDVLTRPGLYTGDACADDAPPRVERLIMLAPPNKGSPLAPLSGVMEVRDQIVRMMGRGDNRCGSLLGFLVDGQREAATDLTPGSAFLQELESRSMPPTVRVTIVTGSLAPRTMADIQALASSDVARRVLGDQDAQGLAGALHVLAHQLGDGCVSADSAAMEGVDDVVHVEANHRSMIRRMPALEALDRVLGEPAADPPAIAIILERLDRTPQDGSGATGGE